MRLGDDDAICVRVRQAVTDAEVSTEHVDFSPRGRSASIHVMIHTSTTITPRLCIAVVHFKRLIQNMLLQHTFWKYETIVIDNDNERLIKKGVINTWSVGIPRPE